MLKYSQQKFHSSVYEIKQNWILILLNSPMYNILETNWQASSKIQQFFSTPLFPNYL